MYGNLKINLLILKHIHVIIEMTSVIYIYDYIVYGSTDGNSDSQIAVVSYVATCHVCVATPV